MSVYRRKGTKFYTYDFEVDGVRYRESTKLTKKSDAISAQEARRTEVITGRNRTPKREKPKIFAGVAADFLEVKRLSKTNATYQFYKYNIRHLLPAFGRVPIIDISSAEIRSYQDKQIAAGFATTQVNHDVRTLRAILRRCGAWERLRPDVQWLRVTNQVGIALRKEQEDALFPACKKSTSRMLYPFIITKRSTGMRAKETRQLKCKQIDFEGRVITVGESKTKHGENRPILMNDTVHKVLTDWKAQHPAWDPDNYVFFTEKYKKVKGPLKVVPYDQDVTKPMGSFKTSWRTAKKRAQVRCRMHDIRHTVATNALKKTKDLPTVARLLGWSPSTMYLMEKKYRHLIADDLKEAVDALELELS